MWLLSVFALTVCLRSPVSGESKKQPPKGYHEIRSGQATVLLETYRDMVILDIRTPKEFKDGHLQGAKNLDYFAADFEAKVDALDKSKTYLIHCASGGRSGKAMKLFASKKFATVYHMNDGYKGWVAGKLPIVKD